MSLESSRRARKGITNVEKENRNHTSPTTAREREMQIVSVSPTFTLPDGWLVEERPRTGPNPSHRVDRYYYEPETGRKFRSLIAVQRYLQEEERDHERIVSEDEDNMLVVLTPGMIPHALGYQMNKLLRINPVITPSVLYLLQNYFESETGKRFRPVRAYEGRLTGENACTATPKLLLKFGTGKQSAHGVKSFQNPVKKCFSVGEDKTTSKASKFKFSKKADSQKKVNFGEEETVHNLTRPPAKVRWVLSGSGGYWRPFLDDSIVPESEKLKWSEAFVQSIHEGYGQWTQ